MNKDLELLIDGPADAARTLVLAHGAGQGMRSPFMEWFATHLTGDGLRVVRFEFPYMAATRRDGRRRPPDRQPRLLDTWHSVITHLEADGLTRRALIIGGKSMGGRMASLIADEAGVAGLVCLGYPFHPPGKPERLRIEHLRALRTPALVCQGERDPFGRREEVDRYPLAPGIRLFWLPDGDHGFKPRKASGESGPENLQRAADAIAGFLGSLGGASPGQG